jgi:hypothetical protein
MDALHHPIEPTTTAEVAAALGAIGRTEDLRFSPDGSRLAIAGFAARTIVVVDVVVGDGPTVAIEGLTTLATDLEQPHGVDWVDGSELVVGDRAGGIALVPVPVPAAGGAARTVEVTSRPVPTAAGMLDGPGSVAVIGDGPEVLVAGNWANAITRHRVGPGPSVVDEDVWLRRSLDLPDGVAASPDGRWIAVSNHNEHVVLVYDRTEEVGPDERRPAAVLRGARYPHGLRFTADARHLLVADAGTPHVVVFRAGADAPADRWRTAAYPMAAVRVLDDVTFAAGHRRPDEGGPKGIDIDPSGRVLAVTTEQRPLGFVDLAAVRRDPPAVDPADLAAYERLVLDRTDAAKAARRTADHDALAAEGREHDARALAARTEERLVVVEADAAAGWASADHERRRAEAAERRAADAEDHLAALRATRLWRAADRPRRIYARLRRAR